MSDIRQSQRGALMIEVLVALAIIIFGVLAVMRVQARLQQSEVEAYQRSQALILLNDMVSRIETNRSNAEDYITTSPLGTDATCDSPTPVTLQEMDHSQWCSALQGAAEETQTNVKVGAMIGGRGCIAAGLLEREYRVTVVWQGLTPTSAPPGVVNCGAGSGFYDDADTGCVNDLCRRYITTTIRFADLEDA